MRPRPPVPHVPQRLSHRSSPACPTPRSCANRSRGVARAAGPEAALEAVPQPKAPPDGERLTFTLADPRASPSRLGAPPSVTPHSPIEDCWPCRRWSEGQVRQAPRQRSSRPEPALWLSAVPRLQVPGRAHARPRDPGSWPDPVSILSRSWWNRSVARDAARDDRPVPEARCARHRDRGRSRPDPAPRLGVSDEADEHVPPNAAIQPACNEEDRR